MSKENNNDNTLTNGEFNDILMVLTQNDEYKGDVVEYFLKRKDEVSNTLKKLGFSGTVLNGKGLLSLLFPMICI